MKNLRYNSRTKTLIALTNTFVYIIDIVTRRQVNAIPNNHGASFTASCAYYPLNYFITAAENGTMSIYDLSEFPVATHRRSSVRFNLSYSAVFTDRNGV